jgi:transcriptional regulator with XRE-family HTH domain
MDFQNGGDRIFDSAPTSPLRPAPPTQSDDYGMNVTTMTTDHREFALGKAIRRARARADLSQARLAERIGVTFQQVQKYENGTNRVHFTRLLDLAEGLGTTPEALLREYREVVGEPAAHADVETAEDRDAVRLMGLAHRTDERTRKAVIDLLSATLRSDAES